MTVWNRGDAETGVAALALAFLSASFPLLLNPVGIQYLGDTCRCDGSNASPSPALLVVLHEFADDERCEYPGSAQAVAEGAKGSMGMVECLAFGSAVMRFALLWLCCGVHCTHRLCSGNRLVKFFGLMMT